MFASLEETTRTACMPQRSHLELVVNLGMNGPRSALYCNNGVLTSLPVTSHANSSCSDNGTVLLQKGCAGLLVWRIVAFKIFTTSHAYSSSLSYFASGSTSADTLRSIGGSQKGGGNALQTRSELATTIGTAVGVPVGLVTLGLTIYIVCCRGRR